MRIMGLDFGSKTVGVAVSDPLFLTAQGVEIIRRKSANKLRRTYAEIERLAAEYEVGRIVLGYPLHLSGAEGERCELTNEFKENLERRTGLAVELVDERLTTVMADRAMDEAGLSWDERQEQVDKIAAVFILQGYLDGRENIAK
ncbi:MAG: Holliday junction resolvase RuvX [Clostridiales bacterium]|nr:Holliday junction resolvase RuvX [Clostridiales bacterium]